MTKLLLRAGLLLALLASAPERADACSCSVPYFGEIVNGRCVQRVPAPSECRAFVNAVLREQDGGPETFRVSFSARNVALPPGTTYRWSTTVNCGRHQGAMAASTVQAAKAGSTKSCADPGTSGTCAVSFVGESEGSVVLDPVGLTEPSHPSAYSGSFEVVVQCPDCADSSTCSVSFRIEPDVVGGGVGACVTGGCFELLPCASFSDCGVPTVEAPEPVTCVRSDAIVPVRFLVRRNAFPASRLPLRAVVTPSNVVDPTDLFDVFPAEVALDFDGGTSQEQEFTIGCHSHGPCWQGVSNELSVSLFDRDGIRVASPSDVQRAEVVVCETPPLRKSLVGQDGDELVYRLTVRNTSFTDPLRDVRVSDHFPGQRVLSARGAIVDWPFDDGAGFVVPLADRLVDADVVIRGSELELSGFDVAVRDFENVRTLPDTVIFEVRTQAVGLRLCGEVEVNDGATLEAHYLVDDDGDGTADRTVPVFHETSPVIARCVCPLSQGYWSTHHRFADQRGLHRDWPIDESTELCGRSWLAILQGNSAPGDAWAILAHQWIAARLNEAEGAPVPDETAEAMAEAAALLAACAVERSDRARALELKDVLEAWNTDESSPGACREAF